MELKYAVIGTGAIGGYFGAKLAQAGRDVHFLFHSDYDYVKKHGFQVDSKLGDFHLDNVQAYNDTKQMPKVDVVIVGLKTLNNELLKNMLPPILKENTVILLIQNGFDVEKNVARYFPNQPIAGGMAFICSTKVGKGHIVHSDYGNLNMGIFQGNVDKIVEQIQVDFTHADIKATLKPDLMKARWEKLLWNIPFNGMSVIMNSTTDKLVNDPAMNPLLRKIVEEVRLAAGACGINLPEKYVDNIINMTVEMKPYSPSMKVDFDAHRSMEIEYIYSNPIKAAEKAGFDMKLTKMLEAQLKFIQSHMNQ